LLTWRFILSQLVTWLVTVSKRADLKEVLVLQLPRRNSTLNIKASWPNSVKAEARRKVVSEAPLLPAERMLVLVRLLEEAAVRMERPRSRRGGSPRIGSVTDLKVKATEEAKEVAEDIWEEAVITEEAEDSSSRVVIKAIKLLQQLLADTIILKPPVELMPGVKPGTSSKPTEVKTHMRRE
jgi:hypothetical protein